MIKATAHTGRSAQGCFTRGQDARRFSTASPTAETGTLQATRQRGAASMAQSAWHPRRRVGPVQSRVQTHQLTLVNAPSRRMQGLRIYITGHRGSLLIHPGHGPGSVLTEVRAQPGGHGVRLGSVGSSGVVLMGEASRGASDRSESGWETGRAPEGAGWRGGGLGKLRGKRSLKSQVGRVRTSKTVTAKQVPLPLTVPVGE